MPIGSRNKTVIKSLIATIQQKEPKLYDALARMHDDLNSAYETLFEGPLPAVDGFNLTRLNGAVLEGIIPDDVLSVNVPLLNLENIFNLGQFIVSKTAFLAIGFGDLTPEDPTLDINPTSYLRIGSSADGKFFISNNLEFVDPNFKLDSGTLGSLIQLIDDTIAFSWMDAGVLTEGFTIQHKKLFARNFAQNGDLSILVVDDNDLILLGESAASTGKGHVGIPAKIDTELPAAAATQNGTIVIDKTNFRICFYTGGLRYYVNGIAF